MFFLQENSGFLLNALLKRGLSEEQSLADPLTAATAAADAFKADAMTPESEDLDTVAPNSAAPSPPMPHPVVLQPHDLPVLAPGDPLEEELRSKLSELVGRANSKDSSSSSDDDDERARWPADKDGDRQREKVRSKDAAAPCSRLRDWAKGTEGAGGTAAAHANGPEAKRGARLTKSASAREEGRFWERSGAAEATPVEQEARRGERREASRHSKRQHKRDVERRGGGGGVRRSASCVSSPALSPSSQEGALSDNQVRI